jgi:hypothetical protein
MDLLMQVVAVELEILEMGAVAQAEVEAQLAQAEPKGLMEV